MSKLSLFYPTKPFVVTQGWGISNPSYLQFGFSRHNGTDYQLGADKKLYAPCDILITDVGFNSGAGNYIRWITTEKYLVENTECFVGGIFMHMESQAVISGQTIKTGGYLGIADNTGFSTGPHTHISLYRLKEQKPINENAPGNRLDTDPATNYTFDPAPYWNGYYAVDADTVFLALYKMLDLLKKALGG